MAPRIPARDDDDLSVLAEFGTVDFEVSYPWGRLFEIRITGRESAGS